MPVAAASVIPMDPDALVCSYYSDGHSSSQTWYCFSLGTSIGVFGNWNALQASVGQVNLAYNIFRPDRTLSSSSRCVLGKEESVRHS